MTIYILGANGLLGQSVVAELAKSDMEYVSVSRDTIPNLPNRLRDPESMLLELGAKKGDYIFNAIGVTRHRITAAQTTLSAETVHYINAQLPHVIGRYAENRNCTAVQIGTDCVFSGSRGNYIETDVTDADDDAPEGGAIRDGIGISISITGSLFKNDLSTSTGDGVDQSFSDGGGAISTKGPITITDTVFDSNTSVLDGGAIRTMAAVTVHSSTFKDNTANNHGGAISGENGDITITSSSTFRVNEALGHGGAIRLSSNDDVIISNSEFIDNEAVDRGGAVRGGRDVSETGSTFTTNIAGDEGCAIGPFKDVTVQTSTFTQNESSTDVGAIWTEEDITASGSLFDRNMVGNEGGAI